MNIDFHPFIWHVFAFLRKSIATPKNVPRKFRLRHWRIGVFVTYTFIPTIYSLCGLCRPWVVGFGNHTVWVEIFHLSLHIPRSFETNDPRRSLGEITSQRESCRWGGVCTTAARVSRRVKGFTSKIHRRMINAQHWSLTPSMQSMQLQLCIYIYVRWVVLCCSFMVLYIDIIYIQNFPNDNPNQSNRGCFSSWVEICQFAGEVSSSPSSSSEEVWGITSTNGVVTRGTVVRMHTKSLIGFCMFLWVRLLTVYTFRPWSTFTHVFVSTLPSQRS